MFIKNPRHGAVMVTVLVGCWVAPVEGADPVWTAVDRLADWNAECARTWNPSRPLARLDILCADIVTVLGEVYAHPDRLPAIQSRIKDRTPKADPAGTLHYIGAVWAPFAETCLSLKPGALQAARTLGLSADQWGRHPSSDLVSLLILLRMQDVDQEGTPRLLPFVAAKFEKVLVDSGSRLKRFSTLKKQDPENRKQAMYTWIRNHSARGWCEEVSGRILGTEEQFVLLKPEQINRPQPDQPLAVSFYNTVFASPERYKQKWLAHEIWLSQLQKRLRKATPPRAKPIVELYRSWFVLLCHGGIPISSFRLAENPSKVQDRTVYHFSRAYEEDLPVQRMFSSESHLATAVSLHHRLNKIGLGSFDPVRHMVMVPFDVVFNDGETTPAFIIRPDYYTGYLDAFKTRNPPDTFTFYSSTPPSDS